MEQNYGYDFKGQAAASGRYRAAMCEAMLSGKRTVLIAQIGHGTTLAAVAAAQMAGASDLLLVMPKAMAETARAQLENAAIAPEGDCIGRKKGCAADMCREALKRRSAEPAPAFVRVWMASHSQAAEIGNWHDAWKDALKDGAPFPMVFVFDAASIANDRSERGRGIRTVAKYAEHAVAFLDERTAQRSGVAALSANFGTVVRPDLTGKAANACEAMCMDG